MCLFICPFLSPPLECKDQTGSNVARLLVVVSLVLEGTLVHSRRSMSLCSMNEQMDAVQYIHKAPSTVFLLDTYSNSLRKVRIFHFTLQSPFYG